MTSDKQDDAALKAYKMRTAAFVSRLKADLKIWIHRTMATTCSAIPRQPRRRRIISPM